MPDADAAICALLDRRGLGKTICPSEAAKALTAPKGDWRDHMNMVHQAVDVMLSEGRISLSWKGNELSERCGPYRIARRSPEPKDRATALR